MPHPKQPSTPVPHRCPVCEQPQTKIQRVLGEGRYGSTSYVCSHSECAIGRDLSKIDTWVAVPS